MNSYEILKEYFGFDNFRKGQKELIDGILDNQDVLGIMPTSGGKSICYQIPSLLMEGTTLVISPLISLMKDQVDTLKEIGIPTTYINSTLTLSEMNERLSDISQGKYKLVYVAPERLKSYDFLNLIKDINIPFIAIDEAHCISQWGHDFRPSYKEIPNFINKLNNRPVIGAFTATATIEIVNDIKKLLNLNNPLEITIGFDRPNLFFQVKKYIDKRAFISNYLKKHSNESGIIYCSTRKEVESLGNFLNNKGYSVSTYHGGMSKKERKEAQEDFIYDETLIMIATNAFGMGIDKSNIRFVIHYNIPQSMEAYYQEAGRAGRDGEKSDCILLFSSNDVVKQKYLIQESHLNPDRAKVSYKNLQYLVDYCHTHECLRNKILEYFGEKTSEDCNNCSNCLDDIKLRDITLEAQKILSCVYRMDEKYGTSLVAQVLNGSKNKKVLQLGLDKISTYGIMDDYTAKSIKLMISVLIAQGYLSMTESKYPVVKLTPLSKTVLKGKEKIYMADYQSQDNNSSSELYEDLFENLKNLRKNISSEKNVPPYVIFSDTTLKEMSRFLPTTKDEMIKIKGVGKNKFDNYGDSFISIIEKYINKTDAKPIKDINSETPSIKKDNKIKSHIKSYNLYKEGNTIDDIAELRDIKKDTVLTHFVKCQEEGKEINWEDFIDEDIEKQVLEVINDVGTEYLKPIKEKLPNDISYYDIKTVIYNINYK